MNDNCKRCTKEQRSCPACAEAEFAALRATLEGRQRRLEEQRQRHESVCPRGGEAPCLEVTPGTGAVLLLCACSWRVSGSLADYQGESMVGWRLSAPRASERVRRPELEDSPFVYGPPEDRWKKGDDGELERGSTSRERLSTSEAFRRRARVQRKSRRR